MLEKVGKFNDLSPKLRSILEEKVKSFGKKVRFKFEIARQNPDPEKKNGAVIYPFLYTLDPIVFDIVDTNEDVKEKGRETAQRVKKVGIVETIKDNGEPDKFRRIRIKESERGVKTFDMEKVSDVEEVYLLLIHPKLDGGLFQDKSKVPIVKLIDEQKAATDARNERTARKKAMDIAEAMTDKEVVEFADAMSAGDEVKWDSTQDIGILRNEVEYLAETDPKFFNDLVESKTLKYKATIKQALDRSIISFDPVEYKFSWAGNSQIISVLSPIGEKNEVDKLADFLMTGGEKANEVYKKIENLVNSKKALV